MKNHWIKKREERLPSDLRTMLENQKFMNERCCEQELPENWNKESLEVVERLYKKCVGFQLVSVQPMLGPCDLVKFNKFEYNKANVLGTVIDVPQEEPVCAKTRLLKTRWGSVQNTARDLATEISREILRDLKNHAGTLASYKWGEKDTLKDWFESLYHQLLRTSSVIRRKTMRNAKRKWIVTSPFIANGCWNGLFYETEGCDQSPVRKIGTLCCAWDIYVDDLFPKNQILVGQTTDGDGYFYNPYVPISLVEEDRMITRYSNLLSKEGGKNYALITIEGL